MIKYISAKRNASIRERLHFISEALKTTYEKPSSRSMLDALASPLYLIGNVYDNFETDSEVEENFCLIHPDKFDGICREFLKSYFEYIFDASPKERNVMSIDL